MIASERALYDDALILKFEDVLGKAVEVIKQWHNMGGGADVWQIYYENAPEMQPIRALLQKQTYHENCPIGAPHCPICSDIIRVKTEPTTTQGE